MWKREKSNFITLEYVLSLLRCKKYVMVLPSFRIHNRDSVFFIVVFIFLVPFIFLPFPLFHRKCSFFPTLPLAKREEQGWAEVSLWSANPCLSILQFNRPVYQYCSIFGGNFYFYCTHFCFGNHKNVQIQKCVISVYFLVSSSCNIWCFYKSC